MFDHSTRVNRGSTRGTITKFHGETDKMVEQRIRASLPDMGKEYKLDIHHAGNIVSYIATRIEH